MVTCLLEGVHLGFEILPADQVFGGLLADAVIEQHRQGLRRFHFGFRRAGRERNDFGRFRGEVIEFIRHPGPPELELPAGRHLLAEIMAAAEHQQRQQEEQDEKDALCLLQILDHAG